MDDQKMREASLKVRAQDHKVIEWSSAHDECMLVAADATKKEGLVHSD